MGRVDTAPPLTSILDLLPDPRSASHTDHGSKGGIGLGGITELVGLCNVHELAHKVVVDGRVDVNPLDGTA